LDRTQNDMFDLSRMEESLDEAERESRVLYYRQYLPTDMGRKVIFPPSLEIPPKTYETEALSQQMISKGSDLLLQALASMKLKDCGPFVANLPALQ